MRWRKSKYLGSAEPWSPQKPPFSPPLLFCQVRAHKLPGHICHPLGHPYCPRALNFLPFLMALGRQMGGSGDGMGYTASPCSPSGETCLHQAAALGQRTICHYIVEAGASLMKTDQQVSRRQAGSPRGHQPNLSQGPRRELGLGAVPGKTQSRPWET